jgi:hypothetical protein
LPAVAISVQSFGPGSGTARGTSAMDQRDVASLWDDERAQATAGDSDPDPEPADARLPITAAELDALTSVAEGLILSGLSDTQAAILLPPCALINLIRRLEVINFERAQASARDSDPDAGAGKPADARLLITAAERDALISVAEELIRSGLSDTQATLLLPMIYILELQLLLPMIYLRRLDERW